jgi:hypothetical protein
VAFADVGDIAWPVDSSKPATLLPNYPDLKLSFGDKEETMRSPLSMPFYGIFAAFSVGMVAIFCGVGGYDPSRVSVAGTVRLDGTPLDAGTIRFISTFASYQPHVDVSLIQEGEYAIPGSESLIPGKYRVEIRSYGQEAVPKSIKSNADEIPPDQRLLVPARYNEKSVLNVEIQHSGLSRFDFDLKD